MFPNIGSILSSLKLIEFFPTKPLKLLESITNQIIDRRKSKLDVSKPYLSEKKERYLLIAQINFFSVVMTLYKVWSIIATRTSQTKAKWMKIVEGE